MNLGITDNVTDQLEFPWQQCPYWKKYYIISIPTEKYYSPILWYHGFYGSVYSCSISINHSTLMHNISSSRNIHYRRNIMELLIINHPILGTYIRRNKYYVHIITNIISVIFWGLYFFLPSSGTNVGSST